MDGTPYLGENATLEWANDFENTKDRIIAQETLPDGKFISTVWLGLDHQFGIGKPLIFETMVFGENREELDIERYSTLEEAKDGHKRMVIKFQSVQSNKEDSWTK